MKEIRVSKKELLEKLKANRATHRKIFEEAIAGYRQSAITELDRRLQAARDNKKIDLFFNLQQPVDQTKQYDKAIGMLELTLDTEIQLTEADYSNFVMDDWAWKYNFLASNAAYSKIAADTIAASPFEEN